MSFPLDEASPGEIRETVSQEERLDSGASPERQIT
jgi:hypothetical protein